jgi:hypothetical protein
MIDEAEIKIAVTKYKIKRAALIIIVVALSAFVAYAVYETRFNGPQLDQLILQ